MPIIRNIVLGTDCTPQQIENICKAGGITLAELEDASYRLPLEQNCAIMEAALTVSGRKNLGLEIGKKTTSVVLGITGHLMQTSKDVFTALESLQQFTAAFTRLYNFYIEVKEQDLYYYCEPLPLWNEISPETARQSVDMAYAGTLHILFLLTGKRLPLKKLMYRYTRVHDTSLHEELFKCRPAFNESCNCMVFSMSDMQTPVIGYNKELNEVFKKLLEEELAREKKGIDFSGEVRQSILKHADHSFPKLEEIAGYLHITGRTLQRKLQAENTNFRMVSDQIKHELACNLLRHGNLTISQISDKLGYTDPSTFQRAFRDWTGASPSAWRKTIN
jgi:AraC-like DNA-binding protein